MPSNNYIHCYNSAKEKYMSQASRIGYPYGWFSWLRHKNHAISNPIIDKLGKDLLDASHEDCIEIIHDHFKYHPTFNNHSFNSYLLDQLMKAFPADHWERYIGKPLVFYQGTLFVHSELQPRHVFEFGLHEANPSNAIESYTSSFYRSAGITASKDFIAALNDALPMTKSIHIDTSAQSLSVSKYIYEVAYSGHCAIDIAATHEKRGNVYSAAYARKKAEVVIIGHIQPQQIVCGKLYEKRPMTRSLISTIFNPDFSHIHTEKTTLKKFTREYTKMRTLSN